MAHVQVLVTFCTTVEPGGAKSVQTYQSPEPTISIPGYFPICYSLNLRGILYWHNFVILPYIGSVFFSQRTLRESSTTVWFPPHGIDFNISFHDFLRSQTCLKFWTPPFSLIFIFTFLKPPKAYSSVFRPSFPGPTPYLEHPLAPLKTTPKKVPKMLFL